MEEGAQEVGAATAHIKASPALARPEIGWYDLDLKRYMLWNSSIFVCIRSLQFPQLLIKTRLQAQHKRDRYQGVWHAFRCIIKNEGFRGLYQGFIPWQTASIFSQFLYISSFEYLRAQFSQNALMSNLIAGGLSSVIFSALQVPIDVVSQRLIVQDRAKGYKGAIVTIREIVQTEGISHGLYRGWSVSLLLSAPYSALWWGAYRVTKDHLQAMFPLQKQEHMVTAASVSCVLTNFIDVLKTRLQVSTSADGQRPTIRSVAKRLWAEEGIRALGKGGLARVLQIAPSSLLVILGYEEAKRRSCKTC